MPHIALIGDHSESVSAHRAIPIALAQANRELDCAVTWQWIATRDLPTALAGFARFRAIWAVPGSPYENTAGVLAAIRWARESGRPFLGTCGGFQHALIEFARNVLGLSAADHAETNPDATELVVTRLTCSLVEKSEDLRFLAGSALHRIYRAASAREGYRCNYGPADSYRDRFEAAGLRFTAFDAEGEPRAAELASTVHPFFIGTLFQPERAALRQETPPIVHAFVQAINLQPSL